MIRLAPALGLLMLLVLPAHAQSQGPEPRDIAAVLQCLKRGDTKGGDQKNCLGVVSGPCLDNDKNNVPDMVRCHDREELAWRDVLNRTVRQLRREMNDEQRKTLQVMQDAWETSIKQSCGFYEDYGQGSVAGVLEAACAAEETARRALFLLFFIQDANLVYEGK